MKYILDTNVFWDVLRKWNNSKDAEIPTKLKNDGIISFALSEISAMEIYSVLGNCFRQKPQRQRCDRKVENEQGLVECPHVWRRVSIQKRMNNEELKELRRLIDDILKKRNKNFNMTIIPLNDEIMRRSIILLKNHSLEHDLHSLDAIIGATSVKSGCTLVTFDKTLIKVLKKEGVSVESP